MATEMESLSYILPDAIRSKLTGRRLQLILVGIIVGLLVVCVILACLVGLHPSGQMVPASNSGGAGLHPSGQMVPASNSGGAGLHPSGQMVPASNSGGAAPAGIVSTTCQTTECLETAARMSENMDSAVDPCQDFYKYACGSWGKRHSIPPNAVDYTVRGKLRDQNREKLRELLEQPLKDASEISGERKLKQFFRMCLHDYGRMRDTGPVLIDLIKQYIKGWYVLDPDNWKDDGWNLNDAISKIQGDFNVDALVKLSVGFDWRTQKTQIMIWRGGTSMHYSYYIQEDKEGVQEAYKDYMRQIGSLLIRDANLTLDGSETQRRVEQFVEDAYGQEEHLAQLTQRAKLPPYTSRYNIMTLAHLEGNFTQLPWRQILQEAFQSVDFTNDMSVKIWPYGYFHLVDQLLRNETTHSRDRIMNNYLVWNLVSEYSTILSWEYKYATQRYVEIALGRSEFPESWKECLDMTQSRMGSLLAEQFLKTHANKDKKAEVEEMYDHIQAALFTNIERLHWMDNDTKARAEEKVSSINRAIAFPDSYFNQTYLDRLHSNLVVNKTDGFLKTFLNVQRFQRFMRGLELKTGNLYYMWNYALRGGVAGTAPSYFWKPNYMFVPPGALQSPYYVQTNPSFANFAGIGTQMAASISKSIGEQGRRVWTNGSWANWWTEDTYSKYLEAKTCFSNYFEGIQVGPFLINGENLTVTLRGQRQTSRVINLITGLRTGLNAYYRWVTDNGGEQMPVGLKMTIDQAFFVSAAQSQCLIRTPQASYNYARYQRPPENVMWNGALGHMEEFAKAFQCGMEDPMAANGTCFIY